MGATCGSLNCKGKKYQKQLKATIIKRPSLKDLSQEDDSEQQDHRIIIPPDSEECRIGVYFQYDQLIKTLPLSQQRKAIKSSRMDKWFKMVSYGLDEDLANKVFIKRNKTINEPIIFSKYAKIGLNNFYETYPHLFMSRLSKGPPIQYRWLAWKVITSKKLKQAKGLYEELLTKGKNSKWMHDIMKDLDRTFPNLPFFNKEQYGDTGQHALMNILSAFSVYNEKVGYCQSMNFVVGFILLMNGGNEKEAFWLFTTLTKTSNLSTDYPKMEGLRGFYKKDFPLLHQYFDGFEIIFQEELPQLFQHFQDIGIPNLLWLQKWFQSLFLYSFPLGLCIRIWDNILVYGTRYILKASIAILRLTQNNLLQLDLSGINDYFKSFKDEESSGVKNQLLPPVETIIEESFRVKLNEEKLDQLKEEYKARNTLKKQLKKEKKNQLADVKQKAIRNIERQQKKERQQYQQFQLQQIEEEKIMMEDIQDESRDMQEDQQAKSSENQQIGGSSNGMGMNADLSSGGQIQKKSQFLPQIVTYEDQSRKSMKSRVHSTRNLNQKSENMRINEQSADDLKLPPIHFNRNYMIFEQTINKELSLTYKNSSENFSVSQSVPDDSDKINRDAMHRVSSNSSNLYKANQSSGMNQSQNIPTSYQQQNVAKYNKEIKVQKNNNIYYQAHQMNLLKRLREQKENNMHSDDRVREESLEDIQDDDQQHYDREDDLSDNRLGESSEIIMKRLERNEIKRGFEISQIDNQQDNEDEDRDVVQDMSQNGDMVSQYSMHRGESDCYITDSNKLNIQEILKIQEEPGINSDTIIHFVNNLPI